MLVRGGWSAAAMALLLCNVVASVKPSAKEPPAKKPRAERDGPDPRVEFFQTAFDLAASCSEASFAAKQVGHTCQAADADDCPALNLRGRRFMESAAVLENSISRLVHPLNEQHAAFKHHMTEMIDIVSGDADVRLGHEHQVRNYRKHEVDPRQFEDLTEKMKEFAKTAHEADRVLQAVTSDQPWITFYIPPDVRKEFFSKAFDLAAPCMANGVDDCPALNRQARAFMVSAGVLENSISRLEPPDVRLRNLKEFSSDMLGAIYSNLRQHPHVHGLPDSDFTNLIEAMERFAKSVQTETARRAGRVLEAITGDHPWSSYYTRPDPRLPFFQAVSHLADLYIDAPLYSASIFMKNAAVLEQFISRDGDHSSATFFRNLRRLKYNSDETCEDEDSRFFPNLIEAMKKYADTELDAGRVLMAITSDQPLSRGFPWQHYYNRPDPRPQFFQVAYDLAALCSRAGAPSLAKNLVVRTHRASDVDDCPALNRQARAVMVSAGVLEETIRNWGPVDGQVEDFHQSVSGMLKDTPENVRLDAVYSQVQLLPREQLDELHNHTDDMDDWDQQVVRRAFATLIEDMKKQVEAYYYNMHRPDLTPDTRDYLWSRCLRDPAGGP